MLCLFFWHPVFLLKTLIFKKSTFSHCNFHCNYQYNWWLVGRASKSCRRADARLQKNFKNLRKIWNFERKRGIKRHFLWFLHILTKFFLVFFKKFYMFLWYFKAMPMRKIFSKEIMPAQKNLLVEGLSERSRFFPVSKGFQWKDYPSCPCVLGGHITRKTAALNTHMYI